MKEFVKTDDFKAMNLGFALDEGMQDLFFALLQVLVTILLQNNYISWLFYTIYNSQ